MTSYLIQRSKDLKELSQDISNYLVDQINKILLEKERAQISLSGGSTPLLTYKILSKAQIPWSRVDVFLGDERWVDPDSETSNTLMIKKSLLSSYPGSTAKFYPLPTTDYPSPEKSADAYSLLLKSKLKVDNSLPVFDLVLLGLGDDGHTASLFPNSKSLSEANKIATTSEGKGQQRVTLTYPVLSASKRIIFLISGKAKQKAIKRLLDEFEPVERTPAKLITSKGQIIIFGDEEALQHV